MTGAAPAVALPSAPHVRTPTCPALPSPPLPRPQCHTFLGTVTYMSPERINGQPYSFPADIWALVRVQWEGGWGAAAGRLESW